MRAGQEEGHAVMWLVNVKLQTGALVRGDRL